MMLLRKLVLPLTALGMACLNAWPAGAQIASARVEQGQLSGKEAGRVSAFLGVPFASPPVGDLRWKPPQPAPAWQGVRKAETLPTSCQQGVTPDGFGPWTHEYVVTNEVGEDCLYANIWTPAKSASEKLPVLVWIHGGGFTSGSASVPIYDGAALAAKGIVVVGINYRVGLYGFMAHPELTAESPHHASGNYGLLDQVAALQWIHANIAAFGGDPQNVTIAGQSAGAAAVHHLIATPLAQGLFARAIAQSGSGMGLGVPDRAAAEQRGSALMQAAGAADLAALRRLSPAQLEAAAAEVTGPGGELGFSPIVDGYFLPDASFANAITSRTPILTGMTADEMTGLNPDAGKATPDTVRAQIAAQYGALAPEFAAFYPAADDAEANRVAGALPRDRGLAAMAEWAKQRRATTDAPVYAYLWTHAEPGPEAARYGAFHSSEIPYVFDTLGASPERPFTDLDRRLAGEMGRYWVNFVKTGDPNGAGLPAWPVYLPADPAILEIGESVTSRPVLPDALRDLFERHVRQGGRLSLF